MGYVCTPIALHNQCFPLMKAIKLLLMIAFALTQVTAKTISFRHNTTSNGEMSNNGTGVELIYNFNPQKVARQGVVTQAIPAKLPSTRQELLDHMATDSTHMSFGVYVQGPDGEIPITSAPTGKMSFTNYNEMLAFSRFRLREVVNLTLAALKTSGSYDPKVTLRLAFSAVHFEETGEFKYWNNFFFYSTFPIDESGDVPVIDEVFVSSLIPQASNNPMFQFGVPVKNAKLYLGQVGQERMVFDTFFRPTDKHPMFVEYGGLHIYEGYLLQDSDIGNNWFVVVFLENGTSFKIGFDGIVSIPQPRIVLNETLGRMKVEVNNATPGTTFRIVSSTNLVSWAEFGTATIGPDGTGVAGFQTNPAVSTFFNFR